MKNFMYLLLLISLLGCRVEVKKLDTISDEEWKDIVNITTAFINGQEAFIFHNFLNTESKDIILELYKFNTELGYEVKDSIVRYLEKRKNNPITKGLNANPLLSYISDTSNTDKSIVFYSEPFHINDIIVCIFMKNRQEKSNISTQKVFFLKKENETLELFEYYDINNDKFYRTVEVKPN